MEKAPINIEMYMRLVEYIALGEYHTFACIMNCCASPTWIINCTLQTHKCIIVVQ